eukprot:m.64365 g.64365  ORF g.64365 m.64365 type:complete len:1340 (-) comp12010_c0_seq4:603-4622(-)
MSEAATPCQCGLSASVRQLLDAIDWQESWTEAVQNAFQSARSTKQGSSPSSPRRVSFEDFFLIFGQFASSPPDKIPKYFHAFASHGESLSLDDLVLGFACIGSNINLPADEWQSIRLKRIFNYYVGGEESTSEEFETFTKELKSYIHTADGVSPDTVQAKCKAQVPTSILTLDSLSLLHQDPQLRNIINRLCREQLSFPRFSWNFAPTRTQSLPHSQRSSSSSLTTASPPREFQIALSRPTREFPVSLSRSATTSSSATKAKRKHVKAGGHDDTVFGAKHRDIVLFSDDDSDDSDGSPPRHHQPHGDAFASGSSQPNGDAIVKTSQDLVLGLDQGASSALETGMFIPTPPHTSPSSTPTASPRSFVGGSPPQAFSAPQSAPYSPRSSSSSCSDQALTIGLVQLTSDDVGDASEGDIDAQPLDIAPDSPGATSTNIQFATDSVQQMDVSEQQMDTLRETDPIDSNFQLKQLQQQEQGQLQARHLQLQRQSVSSGAISEDDEGHHQEVQHGLTSGRPVPPLSPLSPLASTLGSTATDLGLRFVHSATMQSDADNGTSVDQTTIATSADVDDDDDDEADVRGSEVLMETEGVVETEEGLEETEEMRVERAFQSPRVVQLQKTLLEGIAPDSEYLTQLAFNYDLLPNLCRMFLRYCEPSVLELGSASDASTDALDIYQYRDVVLTALSFEKLLTQEFGVLPEHVPLFFQAFDRRRECVVDFTDFVLGMAASAPSAFHCKERVAFVFRGFADLKTNRLPYSHFLVMVGCIHKALELPTTPQEIATSAHAVFQESGLDPKVDSIDKEQFINACLVEMNGEGDGFKYSHLLLRIHEKSSGPLVDHRSDTMAATRVGTTLAVDVGPDDVDANVVGMQQQSVGEALGEGESGLMAVSSEGDESEEALLTEGDAVGNVPSNSERTAAADAFGEDGGAGHAAAPTISKFPAIVAEPKSPTNLIPTLSRTVSIKTTATYPLGFVPHSPAAKQKIASSALEAASPAIGMPSPLLSRVEEVLDFVLHPSYSPPFDGDSGLAGSYDLLTDDELMNCILYAQTAFATEPSVLELQAPIKVFGDLHGQMVDALRFFNTYGSPNNKTGDIHIVSYLFVGDFVDRGPHSLEVLTMLMCLKIRYPDQVFLVRGNHEDPQVNEHFGFKAECTRRLRQGAKIWEMANTMFGYLPLAAVVENQILCVHGGIGRHFTSLQQIKDIKRPLRVSLQGQHAHVLRDVLWADPTDNDSCLGIQANAARGGDVCQFGPDQVAKFLEENDLQMIVRAHQCVSAGYEFFAQQRLITVFSATNYCGRMQNDGAFLMINRSLAVAFRVISCADDTSWANASPNSPQPVIQDP